MKALINDFRPLQYQKDIDLRDYNVYKVIISELYNYFEQKVIVTYLDNEITVVGASEIIASFELTDNPLDLVDYLNSEDGQQLLRVYYSKIIN